MTQDIVEILPSNVKPLLYKLHVEPDLHQFTFKGHVTIALKVQQPTQSITLNAIDLKVFQVTFQHSESAPAVPIGESQLEFDTEKEQLRVQLNQQEIQPTQDPCYLTLHFSGELNDKLAGFYRSVYSDENGTQHVMATTQMEPTDARRAFPCFDEPSLKAEFEISLVHEPHLTALSNMDLRASEKIGPKVVSHFNRTPLMSTYLVAYIVAELECYECNEFRIPVRVWASPGNKALSKYSAELGARTLQFFEHAFDVPYPLPKMDQVAVHDFSAGAMENWGLVTYRVTDLLVDPVHDDKATLQRVSEVVQHELAHQWFGNLVTMEWWDGLWLNEGFAAWMSWFSCDHFHPDWKVWEKYVCDTLQSSLALDGIRASHPVQVPVSRAAEINQIFDSISYSKGSSVLKMLSAYLGTDTFIRGVSIYLKRHKYGNTTTDDLWRALSEATGNKVDVVKTMSTWTQHIGYPVVTVTEKDNKITFEQHRFLDTNDVTPEEDQTLYPIALRLKTPQGVDTQLLLNDRSETLSINDFTIVNADHSGLYLTRYESQRIEKLSKAGELGDLSVEDRCGLILDMGMLAKAGYQKTPDLFTLISRWSSTETSPNVWSQIIARLGAAVSTWNRQPQSVRDALYKFGQSVFVPKAQELGHSFKDTDSFLDQQFKAELFSSAVSYRSPEYIEIAKQLFHQSVDQFGDASGIDANLRPTVYVAIAQHEPQSYDLLLDIYKKVQGKAEANRILGSLGRVQTRDLQERTINLIFDGTVRSQDAAYVFAGFTATAQGSDFIWGWTKENWSRLETHFAPPLTTITSIVGICARGLSTPEQLKDYQDFFNDKNTDRYSRRLAIGQDGIRARIAWISRDSSAVSQWLETQGFLI